MSSLVMKYKKYKQFAGGGYALQAGIGLATAGVGAYDASQENNLDQFGMKRVSVGGSAAKGAVSGAAAGAVAGPWGALIGGVVGGGIGAVSGVVQRDKYRAAYSKFQTAKDYNIKQQGAARIASDPSLVYGDAASGYYENGGSLAGKYRAQNGSTEQLSSQAAEFKGPSHADGGIKLPDQGAEVEGAETVEGDYIFSERLGFAKAHKTLASAVGKIEGKSLAPERVNALKLLKVKTENLKNSQELVKQYLASKQN